MKSCVQCQGTGKVQCTYVRTIENGPRVEIMTRRQIVAVCGVCMGRGQVIVDGGP